MRNKRAGVFTVLFLGIAALGAPTLLPAKNYPQAKALAAQLVPQGLTPKADTGGLGKAGAQVARIISLMQQSEATGGPSAKDLVNTAYDMFRPDVGPAHRTAAAAALTAMWDEARVCGAFSADHKYTGKITHGPEAGQALEFEYIVPPEIAPEFSRDVANLRLVRPSRKRAAGAKLDVREEAYVATLKAISREAAGLKSVKSIEEGKPANSVGQTREEEAALFKEAMKKDGEKALELPEILLTCRMLATPSKRTGYKWNVGAEVTNLSQHATEVEIECIIIGTTDKHRINYIMGEQKMKLQLRSTEVRDLEFLTPLNEGGYNGRTADYEQLDKKERGRNRVFYRGAIFRVNHAKGVAAKVATDPSLLGMLEKDAEPSVTSMPRLYMDPKTWKKIDSSYLKE